ncbi:MAG: hypothetical protein K0R48_935 [Gammaproteobacteria bacterium]|jgi:hypothetical protein|nr:hypothetical protein [Gammaproteobacteria bacterium]
MLCLQKEQYAYSFFRNFAQKKRRLAKVNGLRLSPKSLAVRRSVLERQPLVAAPLGQARGLPLRKRPKRSLSIMSY